MKILIAINSSYLINKINDLKIIKINLLYREAILELLEKDNNINYILISEKIPGQISIEDLIKKIKIINKKIKIIFFLENENFDKRKKLNKLEVENIYLHRNEDFDKFLKIFRDENNININGYNNLINKNNKTKVGNIIKKKLKYLREKISKKIYKKEDNNKIITIFGKNKVGKTTIVYLIIFYLLNKDKKILIINLNNKIEKNYLKIIKKINSKNKKKYFNKKINLEKNNYINKINKNLYFIFINNKFFNNCFKNKKNKVKKYLNYYIKYYDFILIDIGNECENYIKEEFIKNSNKKLLIIDDNLLGIKEVERIIEKYKIRKNTKEKSLHIIQNKYNIFSISNLIFKKNFSKFIKYNIIFYDKSIKKLHYKFYKKQKIKKINIYEIKKILN